MRKHESELAYEGTPLMSGGFVRDLVGTNKPGAKWAEAAALSVSRRAISDTITYSMEAVKEDAAANGFDEEEAIAQAIWACIALATSDPLSPVEYKRVD